MVRVTMETAECHSNGTTDVEHENVKVALLAACEEGRVVDIGMILALHTVDLNGFMIGHRYEVPLYTACTAGHLQAVQCLLELGAHMTSKHEDANKKILKADMAINHAIRWGHSDIVQCLIAWGSDINSLHRGVPSPIRLATSLGHVNIVRHLVAAGCDVSSKDIRGRDALFHATVIRSPQIAKLLLDAGAEVNTCDNNRIYVVAEAARRGYLDMLQLFIDAGCDVNVCVRSEDSPLTAAIESGYLHAAELLLKAGALPDLDLIQGKGSSLWTMLSTNHCRLDILSLILRAGCSVKQYKYGNRSPLQFAAEKGWWDAAFMILNADVDLVKEWEWISTETRNNWVKEAEMLFEVVKSLVNSPTSLLKQSRGIVHRNLKIMWPYWERVNHLPLPSYLKEYLLYNV